MVTGELAGHRHRIRELDGVCLPRFAAVCVRVGVGGGIVIYMTLKAVFVIFNPIFMVDVAVVVTRLDLIKS
jgi:hypothetical protein